MLSSEISLIAEQWCCITWREHCGFYFQVVKNFNFVTMDQLEQDKEIVEFCKKSLSYRKKLSGEEHEVCNQTFFFYNLQMFPISIKNLSFTTNANLVTLLLFALTLLESLLFYLAWQTFNTNASNFCLCHYILLSSFRILPPLPSLFTWPERGMPSFGLWFSCLYS